MAGAFQIGSTKYLISKGYAKLLRHSLAYRHYKTSFAVVALGSTIMYSFLVGPA
ncbi:hypothetical protein F5Y10DRAFT_242397 [Nemania abortiva]|nr:hypothetical protein F5Y10DRAFT_242397 [Nemania abortiva]